MTKFNKKQSWQAIIFAAMISSPLVIKAQIENQRAIIIRKEKEKALAMRLAINKAAKAERIKDEKKYPPH